MPFMEISHVVNKWKTENNSDVLNKKRDSKIVVYFMQGNFVQLDNMQ